MEGLAPIEMSGVRRRLEIERRQPNAPLSACIDPRSADACDVSIMPRRSIPAWAAAKEMGLHTAPAALRPSYCVKTGGIAAAVVIGYGRELTQQLV